MQDVNLMTVPARPTPLHQVSLPPHDVGVHRCIGCLGARLQKGHGGFQSRSNEALSDGPEHHL